MSLCLHVAIVCCHCFERKWTDVYMTTLIYLFLRIYLFIRNSYLLFQTDKRDLSVIFCILHSELLSYINIYVFENKIAWVFSEY